MATSNFSKDGHVNHLLRNSSKEATSFQEFEHSTSDAWDVGDVDDDILSLAAAGAGVSSDDKRSAATSGLVQSTAQLVIEEHTRRLKQQQQTRRSGGSGRHGGSTAAGDGLSGVRPARAAPGVGVRLATSSGSRAFYPQTPSPSVQLENMNKSKSSDNKESSRIRKFLEHLVSTSAGAQLTELKTLSWQGIPACVRPFVWKLLQGYLPLNPERRDSVLREKRDLYSSFVNEYYPTRTKKDNEPMFRQIQKDLVRMSVLHDQPELQELFGRILFIWSMRRPASTYVQGMNDLVTPFLVVFMSEHCSVELDSNEALDLPDGLPTSEQLSGIEADCFWAVSKLLDSIQDNFVFAQPRIQQNVVALRKIVQRVDSHLDLHLENNGVEYLQFSFRWMNNLLMRELPLRCVIRLWDTYQSETDGFSHFHLYVCAAFLLKFSTDLKRERDFQGLMLMLQDLPTHQWNDDDVTVLLAEAYKLQCWFADSPNHLDKVINR